ncbi:MAG: hypothetical protein Fur006_22720 [Coleofasciculaceae cyanobacterium]
MSMNLKIRRGFSFDEAILMAQFSKLVYEIFPYDDGCIEDTELKEIYNAIHRHQGWKFVHSIRNDETNVRGFILKKTGSNQYVVAFRGSILTDRGAVELSNIATVMNWNLTKYGPMADPRIKVVQGFFEAFESVWDQVKIFFKTLLNQLTFKDFEQLHKLTPERQFACATAMADAGAIRLGADFEQEARVLIQEVVADGEIGNNDELVRVLDFKRKTLLAVDAPTKPVEVYVTGHSLGGGLAHLCALALRRCFGSVVDSNLASKVYTFGGPKLGNQHFANYYNEQVGEGLSYRVENLLDQGPHLPLPPPFPLNILAPNGLQIGNFYMGDYVSVGELHRLIGLGSHNASLSFGGALEFLGSIPFPHSYDTYIQLLKEEQQHWHQLSQPIKNVLRPFLEELLQEQLEESITRSHASTQALGEEILQAINSLRTQQAIAQHNGGEKILALKDLRSNIN